MGFSRKKQGISENNSNHFPTKITLSHTKLPLFSYFELDRCQTTIDFIIRILRERKKKKKMIEIYGSQLPRPHFHYLLNNLMKKPLARFLQFYDIQLTSKEKGMAGSYGLMLLFGKKMRKFTLHKAFLLPSFTIKCQLFRFSAKNWHLAI